MRTLALHRGGPYNAFGSKRGIFVAALRRLADEDHNRIIVDVADPRWIVTAINRATG